jgi:hypothetical protein
VHEEQWRMSLCLTGGNHLFRGEVAKLERMDQ